MSPARDGLPILSLGRDKRSKGDTVSDSMNAELDRARAVASLRNEVERSAGDPNPVIRVTPLRAYPGWRVREYANGWFDATDDIGLSPGFRSFAETVAHVREQEGGRA